MSAFSQTGHIFREVRNNLLRNVTLFVGTIATVWVSLTLFGSALIIQEGVEQATSRWKGGIEFIVFMDPGATDQQHGLVRSQLDSSPDVASYKFFTKENAYEEFLEEFSDSPELTSDVTAEDLPPSYRVRPSTSDSAIIEALADEFKQSPGVRKVSLATDLIRTLQNNSEKISRFILITSVVVLVAALLLIFNTIGTAIFARRRDIEVMQLVGASNFFIRTPFVLEGTVQGLLGGAIAIPMLFLLNNLLEGFVEGDQLELLSNLVVDSGVVWSTSIWVLALGAVVGALGSGFAVGRHLKN